MYKKQFKKIMSDSTLLKYGVFIIVMALILYVLYFIIGNIDHVTIAVGKFISGFFTVISPLIIGLVLAYIIDPGVTFFDGKISGKLAGEVEEGEKKIKRERASRLISVLIMYLILISAVVILLYFFAVMIMGKLVVSSMTDFVSTLMDLIKDYEVDIQNWIENIPDAAFSNELQDTVNGIMQWLSENFNASAVIGSVSNLVGSIVNFVVGIIVSIYLLIDKKYFVGFWNKAMQLFFPNKHERINDVLRDCDEVLAKFIRGVLLDALIVATLASVALTVGGLEFGVFVGIVAGMCNVIPYFGPILGMIPAFLVGFLTDGIWQGVIAVVILLVIQQIDGNLIYPKVVGSSTGLHPLFVLLAVTIAGTLGGLTWMILAVPVAGILQVFISKWAKKRENAIEA